MAGKTDGVTRRDLTRGAALGGAFLAMGGMGGGSTGGAAMEGTVFDVRAFGAKGDGKSDDTKAIQTAVDAAGETRGAVFVPPGTYMCSTVRTHRNIAITGVPAWDYRRGGGSILRLADDKAACLLDITEGQGITLDGLYLEGERLGSGIHGIFMNKPDEGREEDAFRIERCKVARFTGDAVRLMHVWCFTIRQSMLCYSGGDGVYANGWDGFLSDNWLSGNSGVGYGRGELCSVTVTANRIEWNKEGGIVLHNGSHYNITGNYIDRSGKYGIALLADASGAPSRHVTVTGNLIYRSGKHAQPDSHESSQILIDSAEGITVVGNTMVVGRDDAGKGDWSPSYGIVYGKAETAVIKDNVLHNGALKELLVDTGGNAENVIVKDNPGKLHTGA